MKKKGKISGVVEEMFDKIIATDVASSGGIGCDNMTCIVVQFKWMSLKDWLNKLQDFSFQFKKLIVQKRPLVLG